MALGFQQTYAFVGMCAFVNRKLLERVLFAVEYRGIFLTLFGDKQN